MGAPKRSFRNTSLPTLPVHRKSPPGCVNDVTPVGPPEPSISMVEFVSVLYRGVLGREPDQAGLRQYVRSADEGLALDEIVRSILNSEEATLRRLRTARELFWSTRAALLERPICFLHILKTGGTALVNGLRRLAPPGVCLTGLYLDHLVALPRFMLDGSVVIAGHLPYEAVDLLPAHAVICTVLRDPVDRTLSSYAHLSRDPDIRRADPDFSLERFLLDPGWRAHSSNHQARQLVHRIGITGAWNNFSPRERLEGMGIPCPLDVVHPLDALFHRSASDLPDDELQHQAMETLQSIELVGVTEELDLFFRKLTALLGVTDSPSLLRENVGSNRLRRADVSPMLLDTILEKNAVDLALHERARAMQECPAGQAPPGSGGGGCR